MQKRQVYTIQMLWKAGMFDLFFSLQAQNIQLNNYELQVYLRRFLFCSSLALFEYILFVRAVVVIVLACLDFL